MTRQHTGSARELCSAYEHGELLRDEFWLQMRERHRSIEEYVALMGRGELDHLEIHKSGLIVVFSDGLRMRWRPDDTRSVPSVTVNHGSYEPREVRALTALAEQSRVVFDIGANAGFVALRLSRAQRRKGAVVHAFEPVPSTHQELLANIELNGLGSRVKAHPLALGEAEGCVKFFVPAFHGSVAASGRPLFANDENREVSVEMTTFDRVFAELGESELDLVKCDVEGAELFALRGGLATLERTRPVLMVEMLRKWAKVYDYHPNDIIALLAPLGYHCYSLADAGLVEHAAVDDATQATNFFFLDPSRHGAALAALERSLEIPASAPQLCSERSRELARKVRVDALRMVHKARASHIGSCLSAADILAVLYASVLNFDAANPALPSRDRFILSKGHAAAVLYAVLAESGFFPREWLEHYTEDGSPLAGHAVHKGVPGVEVSTGSLGHGLSIGVGMALGARRTKTAYRVFVLMSDGECDEGSVWEAALFAGHHGLENLVAIVDQNQIQSFGRVADVLDLEPFADKWRAFGWNVVELDGHDHFALSRALQGAPGVPERPTLVVARTVKGKGVSFMEDKLEWHYRSPDDAALALALGELGEAP